MLEVWLPVKTEFQVERVNCSVHIFHHVIKKRDQTLVRDLFNIAVWHSFPKILYCLKTHGRSNMFKQIMLFFKVLHYTL